MPGPRATAPLPALPALLSALLLALATALPARAEGSLAWPVDCVPGSSCDYIGHPDTDGDGKAFDCTKPGYKGHEGTDISIVPTLMEGGVAVRAAADGVVLWVFDGKYDRCPDPRHPDCKKPPSDWWVPGQSRGYRVCTERGPFCRDPRQTGCFWCFDGANVVVIRHEGIPGVFATRYDHFKKNSITVKPGDSVRAGQKLGEVGSAGHSTAPHLHFEVWGTGYYTPADPWVGRCGPNKTRSLWKHDPPWKKE